MNYPSSPEKPLQHEPPQETGIDRRAFVRVCIAAAIALRGILSEPPVAHADEKKPDLKGSLEVVMGKLTITMKNWDSYHPDHESNTQKMIKDRMANIMPFFEASEIPLEGNVTFTYDPKLTERGILFEYRHHLHAKNIAPSEQRNSIPEWQQISASEIAFGAIDSPSMVHALTHIVFRASLQGSDLWSEGIANSMADRYQEQYPAQETAWPHDRDLSALHDTQAYQTLISECLNHPDVQQKLTKVGWENGVTSDILFILENDDFHIGNSLAGKVWSSFITPAFLAALKNAGEQWNADQRKKNNITDDTTCFTPSRDELVALMKEASPDFAAWYDEQKIFDPRDLQELSLENPDHPFFVYFSPRLDKIVSFFGTPVFQGQFFPQIPKTVQLERKPLSVILKNGQRIVLPDNGSDALQIQHGEQGELLKSAETGTGETIPLIRGK